MPNSKNLQIFIFGIIAVGVFSAVFHGSGLLIKNIPWNIVYSDVLGFYQKAVAPGFPYLDKFIEYPVLTGLFIHFSGFFGKTPAGYYSITAFFLIVAAATATYFLLKINPDADRKKIFTYWVFAPSMLLFSVYNWDLIAVLSVILAFYSLKKDRGHWAAFWLAVGTSAKFYPALFLLPLLFRYKTAKEWFRVGAVFSATFLAINGFFIAADFSGWFYFFSLNSGRLPNLDSIWTVLRFIFPALDNVSAINLLSSLALVSGYGFLIWKYRKEATLKLCFMAVLVFLIFNKVFTPQYLLWLLPFFVLLPIRPKWEFYSLEISNILILFLTLAWFFAGENIIYFYWTIPLVIIRHAILIGLLYSTAKLKSLGSPTS